MRYKFGHMKMLLRKRYCLIGGFLLLAFMILFKPLQTSANTSGTGNLLRNGNFEQGFAAQAGCGDVGVGWGCFTNDGDTNYQFYADTSPATAADGRQSQLLEISTVDMGFANADRYTGLYQTIAVECPALYTVSLRGMIRTSFTNASFRDPWRYRVQIGWTFGRVADWQAVTNWTDVGWDTYGYELATTPLNSYQAKLLTQAPYMTFYVRVWKKWGEIGERLLVNLDSLELTPAAAGGPVLPTVAPTPIPTAPPLKLIGGTPVAELAPALANSRVNHVRLGVDPTTGWPRLFGEHVAFSYPSSWQPTRILISPTATSEVYLLGIGYVPGEQTLGFADIGFQDIQRPDLISVTKLTIGGKEGAKFFRQGPDYVIHEYCTSGLDYRGSFCVRIRLAFDSPMLARQLDRLVQSIVFY